MQCLTAGSSGEKFILCLPFGHNDAEKNEAARPGVPDKLAHSRRDENQLPGPELCLFRADVHLPGTFEEVIEFCGLIQHMGECGFSGRDDGMGHAASESGSGTSHCIRMEEFDKQGAVDDAFMGIISNVPDEHRRSLAGKNLT